MADREASQKKWSGRGVWILVLGAMVVYLILATRTLDRPGLHFDELLHVNAALGGLDSTFIYKEIAGIPVLLMPYIGALKAYLTAPVFALFGVSVATIRLPLILITAATLPLLFVTVRRLFNARTAVVATWLFAVNPTIISLTKLDSGPVVLALLATTASLFFFERLITRGSIWSAVGLVGSLAAGVFHKLNFIWVVNGLFGAVVLTYGKHFWERWRQPGMTTTKETETAKKIDTIKNNKAAISVNTTHRKWKISSARWATLFAGLGIIVLIAMYLVVSLKFNLFGYVGGDKYSWPLRLERVASGLTSLLNGELYINYSLTDFQSIAGIVYAAIAYAIIVLSLVLTVGFRKLRGIQPKTRKAFLFITLTLALVIGQITITRNAVWPWHFSAVEPLLTILLAASVVMLVDEIFCWVRQRMRTFVLIALTIAALVYHLWLFGQYLQAFERPPRNIYWSTAIYELIDYAAATDKKFVSIDWGTHTQLLAFSKNPQKFKNESFNLNRSPLPSTAREQFTEVYLQSPNEYLFILHPSRFTLFKASRQNFFDLIAEQGLTARLVKTIDDNPRAIFEIYELAP